ncbi:MAG: hypothetical protein H0V70_22050 [Ktedonobacteraceae bacterium]|nr:hypothetical protein [Ktedonobacteraceae bacterium]
MNQRISTETYPITWNDTWHCIMVQGYRVMLSPTQYRILRLFAEPHPATVPVADEIVILAYRSRSTLETQTELSTDLLARHICNLNARLMPKGLRLCFFRQGYILMFSLR